MRFCNEDEVLPTTGGEQTTIDATSSSLATPRSGESTPPSITSADSDSVVDVCTVRTRGYVTKGRFPVTIGRLGHG